MYISKKKPQFWDAIRYEVDHRDDDGQFILTGSAVPADMSSVHHTGTGRFARLKMRPMSLWESEESTGEVSLADMFANKPFKGGSSATDLEQLAFLTCRGGWPKAVNKKSRQAALQQAIEYYEAIAKNDISRIDGVSRNEDWAKRLMRSYSRNQASQATVPTIIADMAANETEEISLGTVNSYLTALRRIFVIEDMPAWNPNLRSKTAIRTSDTRYFVDPSLATAALGLGSNDLINDLNTFGLIFETLCVRDLRVYADALGGSVYHYRDKNELECDAVVHLRNGDYGLVEVKLGGDTLIEQGAKSLLQLESKIDTGRMKAPAFKMILVGVGQYAYMRTDGIYVVPISCLKHYERLQRYKIENQNRTQTKKLLLIFCTSLTFSYLCTPKGETVYE